MLTRFQFLAAVHDDKLHALSHDARASWRALHASDPLRAYMLGREEIPPPAAKTTSCSLLSLPQSVISRIVHFVGMEETHGKLCNTCRSAAALSYTIAFDHMHLKARTFLLQDDHVPDAEEMYKLYWRVEKLRAAQGHYWLSGRVNNRPHRGLHCGPLLESSDVKWKSALVNVINRHTVEPLKHIRSLTIPAASEMWAIMKAAGTSPDKVPNPANLATAVQHALARLSCPNLVELCAPNVTGEVAIAAVEKFFQRHRGTLKAYVGAVESEELKTVTGRYGGGFPPIDYRAVKDWQFVDYGEAGGETPPIWARHSKKIPDDVPSIRGIGFSCECEDGTIRIVSLSPSLSTPHIAANIRSIYIPHRPACQVLEIVGTADMHLFSLAVGPCVENCPGKKVEVGEGLCETEVLSVVPSEGRQICPALMELVEEMEFRKVMNANGVQDFVDVQAAVEANDIEGRRTRRLVTGLMERCSVGEVRFRGWSLADPECGHGDVIRLGANANAVEDARWFVPGCECNLSWNARNLSGTNVSVSSPDSQMTPERQEFENHFSEAADDVEEDGVLEQMRRMARGLFPRDTEW